MQARSTHIPYKTYTSTHYLSASVTDVSRVSEQASVRREHGVHKWKKKGYGVMPGELDDHEALVSTIQAGMHNRLLVLPPSAPEVTNRALERLQEVR
jgi:hypothetical protein